MAKRGPMRRAGAMIALAAALACGARVALAQGSAPANTLVELQRQFSACMAGKPAGPAGSRLTIMLMMKRDGSIFGKPRITFSHLEGDAEVPTGASSTTQSARSRRACRFGSRRRSAARSPGARSSLASAGQGPSKGYEVFDPRRRRQPQASAIFSRDLSELRRSEGVHWETSLTRGFPCPHSAKACLRALSRLA